MNRFILSICFVCSGKCTNKDCPFRHSKDLPKPRAPRDRATDREAQPRPVNNSRNATSATNNDDKVEICTFNLRGRCAFNDKCNMLHTDLPYQWQFEDDDDEGVWMSFSYKNNKEIEELFCQPDKHQVSVTWTSQGSTKFVTFVTLFYITRAPALVH